MKKFFIQIIALIAVAFAALYYATSNGSFLNLSPFSNTTKSFKLLSLDGINLNIEVADNDSTRKKGLSGRESLASNSGMLFKFDKVGFYSLWMKGMKFPLDFIWIKNGLVVDLNKNVSPQVVNQLDTDLPIYTPKEIVDSVLEVNAGFIDANKISIGDVTTLK